MRIRVAPVSGDAELERWTELGNRVAPLRAHSVDDVRSYLEATTAHVHLLASDEGEDAGAAFAALEPGMPPGLAHAGIAVLSGRRGRGAGSALLAALSEWARGHGIAQLDGFVEEEDAASLAWTERRGFREALRESRLALDLAGFDPPPLDLPEGVEVVTLAGRPELFRGVYEVACEAYPDIPGNEDGEMEPFEDWLAHDMGGSGDRPEAIFAALAGGEVVGFAKFHLTDARPTVALHDVTGVRRSWRGRGIAGALKRAQLRWAVERGYERLETMNEVANVPIRRLNERLGYTAAPGRILVRGDVL